MTEHVLVRQLDKDLPLPSYAHLYDAGFDLFAGSSLDLEPGGRATVGTGIAVAIPQGYVGFIVPRSGMAAHSGVTVLNAPGTVDAGYRDEVRVLLVNLDRSHVHHIERGDRIAQMVIQPIIRVVLAAAEKLPPSERGLRGLGSSGR